MLFYIYKQMSDNCLTNHWLTDTQKQGHTLVQLL